MATSVTYKFDGKRALVTGAGRGIGRAIAIALASSGAETYALGKTQQHLDSLVAECPSIRPICVDLTDWSATRLAVEGLAPIDLLVNNAGIGVLEPFLEAKPEAFDQTFTVNVKSVLNISQVVAKSLIARGSPGAIVNISSQASVRAFTEHTVYCASKGALDQLTRVMALELGPHKIRVNSVNPTVVMTELGLKHWGNEKNGGPMKARIPLGRFSEISEVVEPVLYLLSDSSSMVHGTFLMVDGGFTVA